MKKVFLKIEDEIQTIDGMLKIKEFNGNGIYWCDKYIINDNGDLEIEENDLPFTANDFSSYYKEASGKWVKFIFDGKE